MILQPRELRRLPFITSLGFWEYYTLDSWICKGVLLYGLCSSKPCSRLAVLIACVKGMNIVRLVLTSAKDACCWIRRIEIATSLTTANRECASKRELAVQLLQGFPTLLVSYSAVGWENHTCLWVLIKLTIQQLGTNQQCCLQFAHCSPLIL